MPRLRLPVLIVVTASAYFVAGKAGLMLAFVHANATAVWPPAGIALAAFLLVGPRIWPGVFIGAFLVNFTTAGLPLTVIGIAVGNTLEGAVAAYLLKRFGDGRKTFDAPHGIPVFLLLAAGSTLISASIGSICLWLEGSAVYADLPQIWFTWWFGDATGCILVAPFIVLWAILPFPVMHVRRVVEGGLLALTGCFVLWIVFGSVFETGNAHLPIAFLCIPFVVWAALRFGKRGAASVSILIGLAALMGSVAGHGPFVQRSANETLLILQAFLAVAATVGLILAADVAVRRKSEDRLRRALEEKEVLLREVHHRVKNNLQVVSSLLSLSSGETEKPGEMNLLREADQRIQAIAMAHEAIYESPGVTDIDFGKYILNLAGRLCSVPAHPGAAVDCIVDADDVNAGLDLAVPVGLILNELISNSMKHAFPENNGTIRIQLRKSRQGRIELTLSDNGRGNWYPRPRLEPGRRQTLGVRLVEALAQQINAELQIDTTQGTLVKLDIPL